MSDLNPCHVRNKYKRGRSASGAGTECANCGVAVPRSFSNCARCGCRVIATVSPYSYGTLKTVEIKTFDTNSRWTYSRFLFLTSCPPY